MLTNDVSDIGVMRGDVEHLQRQRTRRRKKWQHHTCRCRLWIGHHYKSSRDCCAFGELAGTEPSQSGKSPGTHVVYDNRRSKTVKSYWSNEDIVFKRGQDGP